MSHLALHLLGPPVIERDGERVTVDRRKALALLAYLAVTKREHTRDALATLLWPEYNHSKARAGLRNALTSLRKALGEGFLDVDRESVRLVPDAPSKSSGRRLPATSLAQAPRSEMERTGRRLWLDIDEFQNRLARSRTHGHPADAACPDCLSALAEAASLYRDDFMAGFSLPDSPAFDEWQFFQSEGLREDLARALEQLARSYNEQGEYERALPYARRWLALDPLHEPAQRLLMRLYARSGQRTAALRQYAECARVLKEELGASPDEETTGLYQAIKDKEEGPALEERSASPLESQDGSPKHNLPVQLTPFVGREALLTEIQSSLDDPACRLLTLVGPGGSGKTRLALETAQARLEDYPHGVYFVPLAPLESVDNVVPTVAQALGLTFHGDVEPRQQLLRYLRHKSPLLILDNFEHLLAPPVPSPLGETEGGAQLVIDLLKAAPNIKILVTSRARLHVDGERLVPVGGMAYPTVATEIRANAASYSAVKLFLERARWVQPGFEATDDVLQEVVRICGLVAGMPLGIRLATAWLRMLSPAEIATEISQSLDFLETDTPDMPARQRSMRAVFDHSWNLLTEGEREVLGALSVFRGGFTRRAAQQVAGASLRELKGLLEKSLLGRTTVGRYEMHELLRQYSAGKLTASPAAMDGARDRHCAYYVGFLGRRVQDLKGARQATALGEIEVDSENARQAWNWAVKGVQLERLERALEGLFLFYQWRGRYQEGEAACRMAGERLEGIEHIDALRLRARILTWQSRFDEGMARFENARQLVDQSLGLLQEPAVAVHDIRLERAFALQQMGNVASWSGDRQQVRRCYEGSLALYRELGDRWGTAAALYGLGWLAQVSGAYDEARQVLGESLAIRRELGDRMGSAATLFELAHITWYQGQFEEAERLAREIIDIGQELGDRAGLATGLYQMGWALIYLGRFAEARSALQQSVAILDDLGSRGWAAGSTASLGFAEMFLGRYEEATVQGRRALTLARQLGFQSIIGLSLVLLGWIALAEEAYAEAQRLFQEGVAVYQALEYYHRMLCFVFSGLGVAACGEEDLDQARAHHREALQTAVRIGDFAALLSALPAVALLLAGRGEAERAVEIYALASRYPHVANSQWFEDVVGKQIAAVAAHPEGIPSDVVAAAQERGQARDLQATAADLLAELAAEVDDAG